jgi:hypothetical protein
MISLFSSKNYRETVIFSGFRNWILICEKGVKEEKKTKDES